MKLPYDHDNDGLYMVWKELESCYFNVHLSFLIRDRHLGGEGDGEGEVVGCRAMFSIESEKKLTKQL